MRREGVAACADACAYIDRCADSDDVNRCAAECRHDLVGSDGVPALRYAGCVQELSCEAISASVERGLGPLGDCYLTAARAAR